MTAKISAKSMTPSEYNGQLALSSNDENYATDQKIEKLSSLIVSTSLSNDSASSNLSSDEVKNPGKRKNSSAQDDFASKRARIGFELKKTVSVLTPKPIIHKEKEIDQDSDDDLSNLMTSKKIFIFARKKIIPASSMTISCADKKNIKGSALVEIVHDLIKNQYDDLTLGAEIVEIDGKEQVISPPIVDDGILSIRKPREWVMSLGGWKGMMPSKEIKKYFFNDSLPGKGDARKFSGVKLYEDDLAFSMSQHRINIPEKFSISGFEVTKSWQKQDKVWMEKPLPKTDLSYSQICAALKVIKEKFSLGDSEIAFLQLNLLRGDSSFLANFEPKISAENQIEITQFLNYLNTLMFGIEASGLNAALAIGLMTLELIEAKEFSYAIAFKANEDGGVYPYACFGDNSGTYNVRETILDYVKTEDQPSLSMKRFRKNPSLSPVAVKEAILIKKWLDVKHPGQKGISYSEKKEAITDAIRNLISNAYCA